MSAVSGASFKCLSEENPTLVDQLIKEHYSDIRCRAQTEAIVSYPSSQNNHVFSFKDYPQSIFKLSLDSLELHQRYENSQKAREICQIANLHLLVIPQAQEFKISLDEYTFVVLEEEKLDVEHGKGRQEELFEQEAEHLSKALKQLTHFICQAGLNYITWKKMPILNSSIHENENRKIALLDLSALDFRKNHLWKNVKRALFGNTLSYPLLQCVQIYQIEQILSVVKKHFAVEIREELNFQDEDSFVERCAEARESREYRLERNNLLKLFHLEREIVVGNESLAIQVEDLELTNPEQIEAASYILNKINKELASCSPDDSLKKRRLVYIPTSTRKFLPICHLRADNDERFIRFLLDQLLERGVIFDVFDDGNGSSICLQA